MMRTAVPALRTVFALGTAKGPGLMEVVPCALTYTVPLEVYAMR